MNVYSLYVCIFFRGSISSKENVNQQYSQWNCCVRIMRNAASTDLMEEIHAALERYIGPLKEDPH